MNKNETPTQSSNQQTSDTRAEDELRAIAKQIAELARSHHDESDMVVGLLDNASLLQLYSLVKQADDLAKLRDLKTSSARLSDLAVVLAAMFDSESAWQELIKELDKVRPVANRKFGQNNSKLVDDVISETIGHLRKDVKSRQHTPALRARLGIYSGRAKLSTWLHTIAINRVISELRRPPTPPCIPEFAAAPAIDGELQDALQHAIAKLAPADQVFARLLYVYSESQVDVAALLKMTPPAVTQRKDRILSELRTVMGAYAIDHGNQEGARNE